MRVIGLSLAVVLSGCATGFDRGALLERLQRENVAGPDKSVQDKEIQEVRALKPQLSFPCRIAVYLKPSTDGHWHWSREDKEILNSWAGILRKDGIASDVFPMTGMFVNDGDLKHLRMAAARYGADALLVIQGACQTDSYLNPAALFNLTLVGGYIVPGSHRDALFILQGGLIDVGNECLYASVESEGEAGIVAPSFIIEERDAVTKAKKKALEAFGPELLRHISNLRAGNLRAANFSANNVRASMTGVSLLPPTAGVVAGR
jgi:hypothetical protein